MIHFVNRIRISSMLNGKSQDELLEYLESLLEEDNEMFQDLVDYESF